MSQDQAMEELFTAIREACDRGLWSRAVELTRSDAITTSEQTAQEVRLRVLDAAKGFGFDVKLYPTEVDWLCTCVSDDNPCVHVAASVIAYRNALRSGGPVPTSKHAGGSVVYDFIRVGKALALKRSVLEPNGQKIPFKGNLMSMAAGRAGAINLTASASDLEAERCLRLAADDVIHPSCVEDLLTSLKDHSGLLLDGKPISISSHAKGQEILIQKTGNHYRLDLRVSPEIEEVYTNGMARCGTVLMPFHKTDFTPREETLWRERRAFGPRDHGEFWSEIVPQLRRKVPVVEKSEAAPQVVKILPRLCFTVEKRDSQLVVRCDLVYGDPVQARVVGDRLELSDQEVVPQRLRAEELNLRDLYAREFDFELGKEWSFSGYEAVAMAEKIARWRKADVDGAGLESFKVRGEASLNRDEKTGEFHFVTGNGSKISTTEMLDAWHSGEPLVPLLDGGYAKVPEKILARYGSLLTEIADLHKRSSNAMTPVKALLESELGAAWGSSRVDGRSTEFLMAMKNLVNISAELPGDFTATLRPYQERGVAWLQTLKSFGFGALLADDMGLGKTIQVIAVMQGKVLVVVPTSLLENWRQEILRFRPQLKVQVYHGSKRELDRGADVVLTTYALARLDESLLNKTPWDILILDEAHQIKNPESQTTQAILAYDASFKIALTGTPLENRIDDLWTQIHFTNPGLLGARQSFRQHFEQSRRRGDSGFLDRLKKRLSYFMLRRLKTEVAKDLPARSQQVWYTKFSEEEQQVYDVLWNQTRAEARAALERGESSTRILELILRLRQFCCHPELVPKIELKQSAKLELITEMIQESLTQGHKVLLFSQWTSYLDKIEAWVKAEDLPYSRIDGQTRDRAGIVAAFQGRAESCVLLMSLKAGGVGLNLTSADHVIISDPWWNPAVEDQAADRAHRIGQDKPVFIYKTIVKDSIEEKILALQEKKRDLVSTVLEGHDPRLTIEDIKDLLTL